MSRARQSVAVGWPLRGGQPSGCRVWPCETRVPGPGSRLSAGFTLLEILLALALLAFVMLGVWGALVGATRVTRSANALMSQGEQVRTVQQFLRRYVSVAGTHPYVTRNTPRARMFEGDATSMRYVATLPAQSGHAGLYLQTLRLVKGDDGAVALWLDYQSYGGAAAAGGKPVTHRLLGNLLGGRFQYLAAAGFDKPPAWRDEWRAVNGLPLAVRIHLDPAWQARVPFPDMVIPVHAGEGTGSRVGGTP
ncbi:MAG TPA: prepilin-type N-terminal cleavage/methylation domain-containing protein [Rhodanobacteraceae bacterium]|nr:prepilin-type N-terminal cleavage/methylation domain-containing protein [Rhodanobacteraceae bacterium]